MTEVYDFLARGGWLMIPILACSVIGLAFFLERLWALQDSRIIPERFIQVVRNKLADGRFGEAEGLCQTNESSIAAMLEAGIRHVGCEREVVKEVMLEKGERELFFLERFVNAIGAIATISPLLGLLGTVVGMIDVFQRVVGEASQGGAVDAGVLANGIWEALITTAAGLTVAIPIFLAYRYIEGRIDRYAVQLEDVALSMIDYLVVDRQSGRGFEERIDEIEGADSERPASDAADSSVDDDGSEPVEDET